MSGCSVPVDSDSDALWCGDGTWSSFSGRVFARHHGRQAVLKGSVLVGEDSFVSTEYGPRMGRDNYARRIEPSDEPRALYNVDVTDVEYGTAPR